jgi:hypothetical protein
MTAIEKLAFPSGISIDNPDIRLQHFLTTEFDWYDGFNDDSPDHVIPFDVLVAGGMNAFVGGASVARLRTIQEGLATRCDPLLAGLPRDSQLRDLDDISALVEMVLSATYVKWTLSAVATKVLHRKRRELVPILDTVMVKAYCGDQDGAILAASDASESKVRSALTSVISAIREDVDARRLELDQLARSTAEKGCAIGPLRVHDILVWTETEEQGYYR